MSGHNIKITVAQIKDLLSWIEAKQISEQIAIEIKEVATGIGRALEAKVEIVEGEGLWKDLTDYDRW
jgi:hypothetical protein